MKFKNLKIFILFKTQWGPWGGGNQFLKSLKTEFVKKGVLTNQIEDANIILYNSHHNLNLASHFRRKFPDKIFVHRVDGPIGLIRGEKSSVDRSIIRYNKLIADGTVFQSGWNKQKCNELGLRPIENTIILNAANPVFRKTSIQKNRTRTRIIMTSWSSNIRKGFPIYHYLDQNLDFTKYEAIFIGNSPIRFQNISTLPPLPADQLARELNQSEIYVTASITDPCSNSLIEALSCGLPVAYRKSGGHPEIVKNAGVPFTTGEEAITALDTIKSKREEYVRKIQVLDISQCADLYLNYFQYLIQAKQKNKLRQRPHSLLTSFLLFSDHQIRATLSKIGRRLFS